MRHNFHNMDIWMDGVELADMVYSITSTFPHSEVYGLSSQMQRAAVSVPSNIAEGSGKASDKDFARFLSISVGSLYELETQLVIAYRRAYVDESAYYTMITKVTSLQKRIFSFREHLDPSLVDAN